MAEQSDKPESFQKLEDTMKNLFAVPKEELDERLKQEIRKARKRADVKKTPAE
jgi:hypothetical protein